MEQSYSLAPQADVRRASGRDLLESVHRLYGNKFWTWFGITAPPSLLATVVLGFTHQRIKIILSGIPGGALHDHWGEIAEANGLRLAAYFFSWFLGCFALGAIATLVSGLEDEDSESVWKHDNHQRTREHFAAILLAALITFCAFLVGMIMVGLVAVAATRVAMWSHLPRSFPLVVGLAGYVVAASVISWLGMAIPLILRGNSGVLSALKRSMELSNGFEAALFFLIVESVGGSSLAVYAIYSGARFLPPSIPHLPFYGWMIALLAAMASAAFEPLIFLGLSLLADPKLLRQPSSFPGAQSTT